MENLLENDTSEKPPVPEKFLDKETNTLRVDALLKSYLALEKKLAQKNDPAQMDRAALQKILGVPDKPQEYTLNVAHDMFTLDDDINAQMHAKGFTNEQAQFVYDLAAEKMVPLILDIAREFEAERQIDRLIDYFGGAERWQEVSRQLLAYGRKNLSPDVLDGMCCSAEGVLALYRLMQSGKPMALQAESLSNGASEAELRSMMRDPKYWRDRDPAFIKKVSDGFRQVFDPHTQN